MDLSAVNLNVTVDDFDSILSYADQSVWSTPDPSSSTFNAADSPWWMGTFHKTETVDSTIEFNFTGPAIYIYGQKGPDYGSYSVQIDSDTETLSAYSAENGTAPAVLFSTDSLSYGAHQLTLKNLGAQGDDAGGNAFFFDYLQTTVQVAPSGASVSNTTLQEDDSSLAYSGTWDSNESPNFSGGGTSYTNADGASVSFNFHGSTVWVFGDKKNDHGLYNVILDNGTAQTFSGVSGCGGAFGMTCEQQQPCIKYFASNLDESEHSLTIENVAGVNNSFFDLDSIVISVPSEYAPRDLSSGSGGATGTATGSESESSPTDTSNNAAAPLYHSAFSCSVLLMVGVSFLSHRFR